MAGWSFQLFPGLWPSITRLCIAGYTCYRGGCPYTVYSRVQSAHLRLHLLCTAEGARTTALWPRWAGTSHKVLSIPSRAFDGAGLGCILPTQTSVSMKIFQEGMAALAEVDAFLLESLLHCSQVPTFSFQGLGLWGPLPHHLPDKGLPTGGHAAQILCPYQRPELLGNPGSDAACYCLRAHPAQRAEH